MKLYCPRCGAPITSDCINLGNLTATCSACHELFSFRGRIPDDRTRSIHPSLIRPEYRPELPRPARMRIKESDGITTIHWPWRDTYLTPLTIITVAWNSIFIVGCATTCTNHPPPLLIVPFAIGGFLIYTVIAGYHNFARIRATADYLKIEHDPLPWPEREIFRHKITQLSYYSYSFSFNGIMHERWDLYAIAIDGRKLKIAGGLDLAEVHFLQRKLEDRLQLPHTHHPSEFQS